MSKRGGVIFAVVLFVLLFSCHAGAEDLPKFDDSSVIVVTKPTYSRIRLFDAGGYEETLASLGITDTKVLMDLSDNTRNISLLSDTGGSIVKLTLPEAGEDKVLEAVDALNASGTVKYAEPNYYYYLDSVPDDPYYTDKNPSKNYQLGIVDAEKVWNSDINCSNVAVAVLDTGIFAEHEDLKDNIWTNPGETPDNDYDDDGNGYKDDVHGWDFTGDGDNNPDDGYNPEYEMQGHGTHVSGIISAVTDNGTGIASLAGSIKSGGAKIVPLKIFCDVEVKAIGGSRKTKDTSTEWIINAIDYVKKMKIPIANCSWSGDLSSSIEAAIRSCSDTLFVASAGNSHLNNDDASTPAEPAKYKFDNVIAVGASTEDDTLTYFSNYGNSVDIAAPGMDIWSTGNTDLKTDSYMFLSGTSQAAPLVASTAAVLKGKFPSLTPAEIKECIINGASSVESLTYSNRHVNGNLRLSAGGAIRYASGNVCAITWKEESGKIIKTDKISYEEIPEYKGAYNKKSPEGYYVYVPAWEPDITEAVNDTEYTMKYVLADMLDISARLTDDSGTEIRKGDSPQRITAHIDFPNAVRGLAETYAPSVEPFTVILAAYDEGGALAGMAEKTVGGEDMLDTVTLGADINKAINSVKIYIWKTTDSMLPLRNAKDVL